MLKDTTIETKSANPDDLATAFDGFMRAFEAFKDGNDERLAQLEQRMSADVVTTDKVDRINRALTSQARRRRARPQVGPPAPGRPRAPLRRLPPAQGRLRRLRPQGRSRHAA